MHIDNSARALNERMDKSDGRVFEVEIESGVTKKKIEQQERDRHTHQDSVTYRQSQSLRNNLIFGKHRGGTKQKTGQNRGDNPQIHV